MTEQHPDQDLDVEPDLDGDAKLPGYTRPAAEAQQSLDEASEGPAGTPEGEDAKTPKSLWQGAWTYTSTTSPLIRPSNLPLST